MMLVNSCFPAAWAANHPHFFPADGHDAGSVCRCLHDPAWMEREVFGKVPLKVVQALMTTAVVDSIELIADYFDQ
jgi:hypothetical protein